MRLAGKSLDVQVAEIEPRVLDPLHHVGEHLDPRPGAVPIAHVAPAPAAQAVDDLTGGARPPQGIGE